VEDLKYWVGFNIVPGVGPVRFRRLLDYFGEAPRAWQASASELARAGLDSKTAESVVATRQRLNLERELERLAQQGVQVLTWEDAGYPRLLKEIHAPPPLLYVKGQLSPADDLAVAIVGTRRATVYGKEVTARLAGDLARNRVTVVSGLAKGIDALAHRATLDAGGRTIAVLGSGMDIIYPPEHARLARDIVERGALVTDYPLGTQPEAGNFPPRNRIISGLSLGTVIVEAGEGSGALITADYALEQNREVFAVPGNITSPRSRGCNRLIQRSGAKLVLDVADILEELNLTMAAQQLEMRALLPENEVEAALLQHISTEPVHVDEIGREAGLPIATVSSTLAMMELKGMVRQVGGMNYVLAREERAEYRVD
jgi:DNA processing protein